ncbi:hypothetical protein BT63DRAFT_25573 [Microthyrium microscopicum]|uniref:Uncharacterized protein n=1 Tax=Microthyrium microscopicum TaxID=703497 RepID=A0A6A6URQ9_9PEZI|nr:hypothetical protein BT63DRAFT_25573 [Microthyrium microscopicum]
MNTCKHAAIEALISSPSHITHDSIERIAQEVFKPKKSVKNQEECRSPRGYPNQTEFSSPIEYPSPKEHPYSTINPPQRLLSHHPPKQPPPKIKFHPSTFRSNKPALRCDTGRLFHIRKVYKTTRNNCRNNTSNLREQQVSPIDHPINQACNETRY